jgi:NAD(P)-dependent dehydrogenase (short-subunit alcohol dehydrogenase family)
MHFLVDTDRMSHPTNRFPEKRVMITGAGSGLGRALALRFAAEKWRVAVTDVKEKESEETLARVRRAGGDGFAQQCDVRKEADWEALRERVRSEWRGIDVVVNNAGVAAAGSVVETPMSDWEWVLDINLLGVVRGCRTFVPLLLEQRSGHVVNIASFAAVASAPGMAAYNVAKAGVVSLSESLRAEVFDEGVDVTVVCPSFFPTNLVESFRSPDPAVKAFVTRLMQRARVTADDVAGHVFDAVMHRRFLVVTHEDSRWQLRLKRAAPELFYREVRKAMKRWRARAAPSP